MLLFIIIWSATLWLIIGGLISLYNSFKTYSNPVIEKTSYDINGTIRNVYSIIWAADFPITHKKGSRYDLISFNTLEEAQDYIKYAELPSDYYNPDFPDNNLAIYTNDGLSYEAFTKSFEGHNIKEFYYDHIYNKHEYLKDCVQIIKLVNKEII